jgi:hypothetical protein
LWRRCWCSAQRCSSSGSCSNPATATNEPAATATAASGEQGGHDEAAEAAGGHSDNSTYATVESGDEKVLGVDIESPGVVAVGVGFSVVLAALAWLKPHRTVFVIVAVFASAFAVLDVAEILHLLDKSETGLAVLAAAVAVLHVLAAGASTVGAVSSPSEGRPIATAELS